MDVLVDQPQYLQLNLVRKIFKFSYLNEIKKQLDRIFIVYFISKSIITDPYGGEYNNEKDKGPGWTTVPCNEFTKFTMKRSPARKFLESGATVIYINTKVIYYR